MQPQVYPFVLLGTVYRPFIPVQIVNPKTHAVLKTLALIDTGADNCVFPKFVAEQLGYDLKSGEPSANQGLGDEKIEVWSHPFRIELPSSDRKTIVWKSKEIMIRCVDHDKIPLLLGFGDFIGNFKIGFNLSSKRIVIQDPL